MVWPEKQKRIFMLTDGMVDNKQQVIEKSTGTNDMKFYTFGFGDGCDKDLVEKVAKQGRGSHDLIGDDKSHLVGGKIILALEKAFEPSFQQCKYKYSLLGATVEEKFLGEVHRNELVYKTLFVPEQDLESFLFEFEY